MSPRCLLAAFIFILTLLVSQAMEANTIELDPSGQELEGRRTIAGEISSVNHRTPCPSAPPIEGRVKSNDQKRQSKSEIDKRYNENRKQKEDEIMKEVESLEKISGELERENDELEWQENQLEVTVYEEYGKIVSLSEDNNAGQNTDINTIGEISVGHDGLNGLKREMNQAPITSNAGTFSRENASMNLQLAGSSGLTDMRVKKRIADKKCRDKRKRKINEAQERIKELQRKNDKLQLQNVKSKAKTTQLQKQLAQYRNISALMTSKNARRNALLEQVFNDHVLQNYGQGSTSINTQLPFGMIPDTGEAGLPVYHPPVYQSGDPAIEESLGLPQSHVPQGLAHENQGLELVDDLTFSPSDLLCFDNEEARELETTSS